MKLVDNKVEEFIQKPGIDGVYDAIASAARICYQTDVNKMKMAPKEFVENVLLKNGHTRPLEFGTVYLKVNALHNTSDEAMIDAIIMSPYTQYYNRFHDNDFDIEDDYYTTFYITTNMRVIMQGYYETDKEAHANGYDRNFLDIVEKYWCEPTEFHHRRRTFTMWMSRGCTDDNRTHITLSSICESTRFCNYAKDKFGNELTFIKPYWIEDDVIKAYEDGKYVEFLAANVKNPSKANQMEFLKLMELDEKNYLEANTMGLQPQQLKRIFPLGVKAELRLCGFNDAWENFFWRRSDDHADPECKIVSDKIIEIYYIGHGE